MFPLHLVAFAGGSDPDTVLRDSVLIETQCALRADTIRIRCHGPETRSELYDLQKDPKPQSNLWHRAEAAELQIQMMGHLIRQMALNVDPHWLLLKQRL
ncbi:hypothetical protein [Tichowtungia aerotolerans]|uniref:Uncharacterized protein n=1 Tax=Tichowtungia aerotolerans TaxID=2697043 RepID=A0A6P1M404_9BACT|nr:hypothetical protein [Tichowtungia aerotolerans]QHI68571.1 hypothetical protein GT409_03600 [Tichowtungia aerotolerans]